MILIFTIDIIYNYFSKLNNIEKILIKNKSFLEDLSKGLKLKSVYTTKGEII